MSADGPVEGADMLAAMAGTFALRCSCSLYCTGQTAPPHGTVVLRKTEN